MEYSKLPDMRAALAPDGPCIADADTSLSNIAFFTRVLSAAGAFSDYGVGPGDVVALMLPNQVEFVVAMFAAWRLGAAITPINPGSTRPEASYQILDSHAKLLINITGESVAETVPALSAGTLKDHPPSSAVPVADPAALALLIYTSGTTGKPKGVMLDHANIDAMTEMGHQALHIGATDHCLLVLPLFHVNGIVVSVLMPLSGGGRVSIRRKFDIATFFSDVELLRPTFVSAVPTIYALLNALPEAVKPDTSSVRYGICGAAPAPVDLLTDFEARYGFPLVEAYGLSEGTCGSAINPVDGLRKAGTVGLPFPGQLIAIANLQGRHLPSGETGEVLIKGANVMRGYLGNPDETANAIVDGWLHTGDLGRIDEDGYLSIVGRLKDMIIRGGENIYPKEIEDVIYELPDILEAAVTGAPHKTLGEIVVAHIALRSAAAVTTTNIDEHCASRLARHKRPAIINILHSLPKNAVGKIDKIKLRELSQGLGQ
jgi:long-chain acyl-CoA synthetase